MPKTLQKYLSKIKKPPSPPHIHLPSSLSASASWIMKKRNLHSKTSPVDPNPAATPRKDADAKALADVDRFLFDNFKSLYFKEDQEDPKKETNNEKTREFISGSPYIGPPRELCTAHHSSFVGPTSLTEEARSSTTTSGETGSCSSTTFTNTTTNTTIDEAEEEAMGPEDFIALFTYSPSPYEDFKASMNEMVGARLKHHEKVDWEFMEELLFCYMNLNDRKWSKYILRAFTDIVVDLRISSPEVPVKSKQQVI